MTQLYKVQVPGRKPYYGEYTSAGVAIVLAQCLYGMHSAKAIRGCNHEQPQSFHQWPAPHTCRP